jgi:hypothetical protein
MIKYIKIYYVILLMESHFLVSDYISKNSSNNVEELRKNLYTQGILSKDYPEEGLVLLYNRYENNNKNELQNECRSVILDRTSMDIVCYTCNTPICNMKALNFILSKNNSEMDFYKCYEGTLLSSFNHNGKWYLSTRRCLDSNNSKLNNMSHQDMFLEVLNQDGYESLEQFYEKLNPEYCYYFILIHNKNIHLVDYQKEFGDEYKKLCLAFVREKTTQKELSFEELTDLPLSENLFVPEKLESLESFDEINRNCDMTQDPTTEGVVVKVKLEDKFKLLKLQTLNYQFCKAIGPQKNIFRGFIHLYQVNKLQEYFDSNVNFEKYKKIVNPLNTYESYDTIGTVDAIFKVITSELFELYKLLWNFTTSEHKNTNLYDILPKEYKTLLFGIRGMYFKQKGKYYKNTNGKSKFFLKIKDIYQYLKTLNSESIEKLLRVRKLMFNWVKNTTKETNDVSQSLKEFNTVSKRCDKVHCKLIAIYTNILFPEIMPDDTP